MNRVNKQKTINNRQRLVSLSAFSKLRAYANESRLLFIAFCLPFRLGAQA